MFVIRQTFYKAQAAVQSSWGIMRLINEVDPSVRAQGIYQDRSSRIGRVIVEVDRGDFVNPRQESERAHNHTDEGWDTGRYRPLLEQAEPNFLVLDDKGQEWH